MSSFVPAENAYGQKSTLDKDLFATDDHEENNKHAETDLLRLPLPLAYN